MLIAFAKKADSVAPMLSFDRLLSLIAALSYLAMPIMVGLAMPANATARTVLMQPSSVEHGDAHHHVDNTSSEDGKEGCCPHATSLGFLAYCGACVGAIPGPAFGPIAAPLHDAPLPGETPRLAALDRAPQPPPPRS